MKQLGINDNDIARVIKSRRMRRARSVTRMGKGEVHTGFWWRNLRERDHLENPGVDGSIIMMWIFRKCDGGVDWIDLAEDWVLVNSVMYVRLP
jgi:hypothetical protein